MYTQCVLPFITHTAPTGDDTLTPDDAVDLLEELLYTSTEPVLRARSEAEGARARGHEHTLDVCKVTQLPIACSHRVHETNKAQTDMEGHCRRSQEPYSQLTSSSRESGSSSFPQPLCNRYIIWPHSIHSLLTLIQLQSLLPNLLIPQL